MNEVVFLKHLTAPTGGGNLAFFPDARRAADGSEKCGGDECLFQDAQQRHD